MIDIISVIGSAAIGAVHVYAQEPAAVVDMVGGVLPNLTPVMPCVNGSDGCAYVAIVMHITEAVRPLLTIFAGLIITITGFRMIVAQEDDAIDKGKKIISACIAGVMLSYLTNPFIDAFYGGIHNGFAGTVIKGNVGSGAAVFVTEVQGLINWATVFVATIAIVAIIISAFYALAKSASEEGVAHIRRGIVSTITGLASLALIGALNRAFGLVDLAPPGSPDAFLAAFIVIDLLNFFLFFLALAAVLMIVYAGILMMMNFGNEEQVKKARSLIIRVGIGFVVILASWTLIAFIFD